MREASVFKYKQGTEAYKEHKLAQQHHRERMAPKVPEAHDDPAFMPTEGEKDRREAKKDDASK